MPLRTHIKTKRKNRQKNKKKKNRGKEIPKSRHEYGVGSCCQVSSRQNYFSHWCNWIFGKEYSLSYKAKDDDFI
ncbi:hypothetical protein QUC31_001656 [Theobroma cacao]